MLRLILAFLSYNYSTLKRVFPELCAWVSARGNIKIGRLPSISQFPGRTCMRKAPCLEFEPGKRIRFCYPLRTMKVRKTVAQNYRHNTWLARFHPRLYFLSIGAWLAQYGYKSGFFRWHVGGDIPSFPYLIRMLRLAESFPHVRFLCFTKRYAWVSRVKDRIPPNLAMVLSAWPELEIPDSCEGLPRAYMDDGTDTRIPSDAIHCHGGCDTCGMCWNLPSLGRDVRLHKH